MQIPDDAVDVEQINVIVVESIVDVIRGCELLQM